jgi:DNA polymerase-3 subunit delta'
MTLYSQILPWQLPAWDHLSRYITQKRIPQALLITGQKGLGKQQLAEQFAFSLLCASPKHGHLRCGHCDSCLLLAADTHPDYILIQPEESGKAITIGQIRSLIVRLTLKPQFEAYRVVIINPAEQMNKAAANAFLKCLEEPAERTAIILVTDKPAQLPATIISRCQKLALTVPDKETQFNWLRQQNIHDHLEVLSGLSQGAPLLAKSYADEEMLKLRNQCFKAWLAVAKQKNHPVIVAEDWLKLPETPLLFWLTSWVVDLIRCCYRMQAERLYNPDLYGNLQELSQQLELKRVYRYYDLLLASRQRLATPINKQSMFEEILIHWFELNQRH